MKILFLNGDTGDYLNISVLHGLKCIAGLEVYDYPKSEVSYKAYKDQLQPFIRGKGFSLFFTLPDTPLKRFHLLYDELVNDKFDLIIFGDIQSSFGLYYQLLPYLKKDKVIILDGSDSPALFGYSGAFWRKPYYWIIPKPHKRFLYFKREWTADTAFYRFYKIIPRFVLKYFSTLKNLQQISFSIPEEKIINHIPVKTKLFAKHIVDKEVAENIEGSFSNYAFESEDEYYQDLQASKFGITTKRSGWDCLRHYEIAANGTVICFKNLSDKPATCAPHGLVPGINCISYKNYADLKAQISMITDENYNDLQNKSLLWIKNHSTINIASNLIKRI